MARTRDPDDPDPGGAYDGPQQLKKIIQAIHQDLFGPLRAEVHPSEVPGMKSAYARAADEIPPALRAKSKQAICEAVAHFVIHLGHLYGVRTGRRLPDGTYPINEGASRETALAFACKVMEDGGYQLPPDDQTVFEANFAVAVQSKQATEVEDLLDKYWH